MRNKHNKEEKMDHRIEAKNANEANLTLKRFNDFHDGYVEKIEIKFEIIDFTTY